MARWSSPLTVRNLGARRAAMAVDRASLGSFFCERPDASTRTRAASVGGTSTTASPPATSCWASRCPSPLADSIAHTRSGNSTAHFRSRSSW